MYIAEDVFSYTEVHLFILCATISKEFRSSAGQIRGEHHTYHLWSRETTVYCLMLYYAILSSLHLKNFKVVITKTCGYNFDPLKPLFYIVNLGFTGVYIIFLISAQKHRLWILVETASSRWF